MAKLEIGAMPWLMQKNGLHVVLVTSRKRKRWILPKGQPEDHLSAPQLAKVEAYEEAGIRGVIQNKFETAKVKRRGSAVKVKIYPIKVERLLDKWPEDDERERRVVHWQKAIDVLDDDGMGDCVKKLVRHLG